MMRLYILDLNRFLQSVNGCRGVVYMICPDGWKLDINRRYAVQDVLHEQYRAGGNYLAVSLDIPDPHDYMRIVYHYIGAS